MSTIPAVRLAGLSHTYAGGRKRKPHTALDDITLDVVPGEIVAFLGPNGSGKSTLLRILTTALKPSEGVVQVNGIDVCSQGHRVRPLLGVVFQRPALDRKMTVAENVRAMGLLYGLPRATVAQRMGELLQRMDLTDRSGELVESLSGGMARKVELAKALLPRPQLLILDEPTAGLDPVARQEFWRLLAEMRRIDVLTVLISTHMLDEAERSDRVAILHRGKLLACDRPELLQEAVGREVLSIAGDDLITLRERLKADGLRGTIVANRLHIPLEENLRLDDLRSRYGALIRILTVSHPSMDDVFIHYTGEHLEHVGDGTR